MEECVEWRLHEVLPYNRPLGPQLHDYYIYIPDYILNINEYNIHIYIIIYTHVYTLYTRSCTYLNTHNPVFTPY